MGPQQDTEHKTQAEPFRTPDLYSTLSRVYNVMLESSYVSSEPASLKLTSHLYYYFLFFNV